MGDLRNMYVAVVDDDESLFRSLARLLRASGIQAVTYLSAEAFLDDSQRCEFDCLVLDVQLGGMSGIELNQRLAACDSTTPVIFLTAYEEPEVGWSALCPPCVAYLRKTDPAEVVLAIIRQAVERRSSCIRRDMNTQAPFDQPQCRSSENADCKRMQARPGSAAMMRRDQEEKT